jgi:predicted HTH domain antitoxin
MQRISVDLPGDLINIFKIRERDFPSIVRETLSIELYREGLISIGNYYPEDLEKDIRTLKKVMK